MNHNIGKNFNTHQDYTLDLVTGNITEQIPDKRVKKLVLFSFLLSILILTIYHRILHHGFLQGWDDNLQVVNNLDIQELSISNVKNIFKHSYVGMYQPITTLFYAIDTALLGPNKAVVFHIQSIIFHIVNAWLLIYILFLMGQSFMSIAFISLIFAIHPLQVEAVCWISATSTLIYSFFYLLTVLCYLKYKEKSSMETYKRAYTYYGLTCLFFTLAVLSKVNAIIAFLILILIDLYFDREALKRQSTYWRQIPLIIIAIGIGILAFNIRDIRGGVMSLAPLSWIDRILFPAITFFAYIQKYFWPTNLVFYYPPKGFSGTYITNSTDKLWVQNLPDYYLGVIFFLVVVIAIIITYKQLTRFKVGGIIFFFLNIMLTLKVFSAVGMQIMSDRYQYLASIGISFTLVCILKSIINIVNGNANINANRIGNILVRLVGKIKTDFKLTTSAALIGMVLFLSLASYHQSKSWENELTLAEKAIAVYPNELENYMLRSRYFYFNQNYELALKEANEVIKKLPYFSLFWDYKGILHASQKQYIEAITSFNQAIGLYARDRGSKYATAEMHFNRGVALYNNHNFQLAINDFDLAERLSPEGSIVNRSIYFYKVLSWLSLNNIKMACQDYNKLEKTGMVLPIFKSNIKC